MFLNMPSRVRQKARAGCQEGGGGLKGVYVYALRDLFADYYSQLVDTVT